MATAVHPLQEPIVALLLRRGGPFEDEDPALARRLIGWALGSGQWSFVTNAEDQIIAWAGWFRLNAAARDALRTQGLAAIIRSGTLHDFTTGPLLHVHTAVAVPGARRDAIPALYRLLKAQHGDAAGVSWQRNKPDGRRLWQERTWR